MSKKILFRVDAGDSVGLGHYYRSLNLAEYLSERGHYIEFFHKPSTFWDKVSGFAFPHRVVPEAEEEFISAVMVRENFNLFYADGMMEFSASAIQKVKEKAPIVFYQNLTSSRTLADIFILPSIHQKEDFFQRFPAETKIYQGLEYFTFNKEVTRFRPKHMQENEPATRIGVIAGGSDPRNILQTVNQMLKGKLHSGIDVTFYYGQSYMHLRELPAGSPNWKFSPYAIADILENDLLIAAFGVSTYEFMYLGMPIISIAHQKSNQAASKAIAEKTGAILDLGVIDDLTSTKLVQAVEGLINNPALRRRLAENGKKILDLDGVSRVASIIENV